MDLTFKLVEIQGRVEISPAGARTWVLTQTNQVLHASDRVRTGEKSRAAILWSDQSVIPLGASTEIEILPPPDGKATFGVGLARGVMSFFHRDRPGRIRVITRGSTAGIEGTEFVIAVDELNGVERATISVIDGRVAFSDATGGGTLSLGSGEQAVAETGKAPVRTAGFIANNILQWCFYYPAILDLKDLVFAEEERRALAGSLDAYHSGDLLRALAEYPAGRLPASDAERVYHAALLFAVGEVGESESLHASLSDMEPTGKHARLAVALRLFAATVRAEHGGNMPATRTRATDSPLVPGSS